jgi:hypothetical protein
MTVVKAAGPTALALAMMLGAAATAFGQSTPPAQQGMGPGMGQMHGMMGRGMGCGMMGQMSGMMGPGMMQQMPPGMMGPGMMGPGMMGQMGPGMMGPGMMGQMGPGMMGPGMMGQMGPGMMGPGMMGQGMGAGMMGHHPMMGQGAGPGMMAQMAPGMMGQMGPGMGGWSGLEGMRVVPMIQLSADDVRVFLERYLESLGNARLKVGKVTETDKDTITAEIVTVDDSLVESFAVDRHTGVIATPG